MEKYLYTSNKNKGDCNFVLAYPESEEFALSSLGYMGLFQLADTSEGINAVRISTDNPRIPFKDIDGIAFSLSFDFDFTGVFKILEINNIPFKSSERSDDLPLVFAGGPVITTNPAPYCQIFDFMLIGDGEKSFSSVLEIIKQGGNKKDILKKLSKIEGVYVPGVNKSVKNLSES